MKITTINPQIITNNDEPVVSLFQDLGFEKRHNPKGIGELNVKGIRMKDANGFHLDISRPDVSLTQDMVAIRMNVDCFDEAYEILKKHGFKNVYGDNVVKTEAFRSAMMISQSGFAINLVQHIKERD